MIGCWVVCCVAALLQCCCFAVLFLALAVLLSSLAVLPSCCLVGLVGFPVIGCCLVVSLSPFLPFSPSSLSPFRFPILTKNRPRIDRKSTQNGDKIEKTAFRRPKWHQMGPKGGLGQCPSPLLDHFGVPPGTPKSTENRFLIEKLASEVAFSQFFLNFLFMLTCCFDLGRFLKAPTLKK